jgi:hypothetical protein
MASFEDQKSNQVSRSAGNPHTIANVYFRLEQRNNAESTIQTLDALEHGALLALRQRRLEGSSTTPIFVEPTNGCCLGKIVNEHASQKILPLRLDIPRPRFGSRIACLLDLGTPFPMLFFYVEVG